MQFVVLHVLWAWLQLSDAGGTATLGPTFEPVQFPNTHRRVLRSETNGITYALQVSLHRIPRVRREPDRSVPRA